MCIGKRGTNLIVHLFYVLFLFISANVFFASASIESSRPTESEKDEPMRNEDSTKISSPLPINETLPRVPKCCDLGFGFFFANKSKCIRTQNQFLPEFSDRPDYSKKASALPVLTRYEYYIGDPCLEGK